MVMNICFSCFKEFDENLDMCPWCGSEIQKTPNEPIHLVPGTVLQDRYVIGLSEGSGGFGIVYKAWDKKLETVVAVKEFYVSRLVTRAVGEKELIIAKKSLEEFNYRKERFLAEARNMAKFGDHKSIPNVFEFFEENNTAYIVMELLEGMPLNEFLIMNNKKIDVQFAIHVANEVGNALKSLHAKKIIHKDVAPDNIFICSDKENRIKLMDLGAAKLTDSTDKVVDIVLKPGYSPIEQYEKDSSIGPWTDIYALGATMYSMITGIKPEESSNRKIEDKVIPPHELDGEISENLSNAIMKAIALEPHMRFKDIDSFLKAINGDKKVVSLAKEKKQRKIKQYVSIFTAVFVVLIGITAVVNMYLDKKSEQFLKPAEITMWVSVKEGSSEPKAIEAIKEDFIDKFPDVQINITSIPESEYYEKLKKAAEDDQLPTLFESSNAPKEVLDKSLDLKNVIKSQQFNECNFLNQYKKYYSDNKKIPLAIEIPVAYVITNGATLSNYKEPYFSSINDFGKDATISKDSNMSKVIMKNFEEKYYLPEEYFLDREKNKSAILLSTTMKYGEVRSTMTNYEKSYVFYKNDKIYCDFIYEWSIGSGNKDDIAAAERLLSWMLGNVYQNKLMISECSDGQIPLNKVCFQSKIQSTTYEKIDEIYNNFVFERDDSE